MFRILIPADTFDGSKSGELIYSVETAAGEMHFPITRNSVPNWSRDICLPYNHELLRPGRTYFLNITAAGCQNHTATIGPVKATTAQVVQPSIAMESTKFQDKVVRNQFHTVFRQ